MGTVLHSFAEGYLVDGTTPDLLTKEGNLFLKGLPYLPGPKAGHVEGNLIFTYDGVTYNGFIDFRGPLPANAKFMGEEKDIRRVVLDHKTSSSPDKYGLWGVEAFLANPQSVLYGAYDVIESGDAQANLRWLYYWTKGSLRAKPSDAVLTRAQLEDAFEPVVHLPAKEIVRLKVLSPEPMDIDPSPESCSKYGGCPYQDRCGLTNAQKIAGAMRATEKTKKQNESKENKMGALDRMKANQAKVNGAAGTSSGTEAAAEKEDKINPPEAKQEAKKEEEKPAAKAETKKTSEAARELAKPGTRETIDEMAAKNGTPRAFAVAAVLRSIADLLEVP